MQKAQRRRTDTDLMGAQSYMKAVLGEIKFLG